MEQTVSRYRDDDLSPYRVFSEDQWARLRADTPMTLTASEVARLQSLNDPVSIAQVESILLPLSRLLAYYVEATQQLHRATNRFLGSNEVKNPFVIGLAGSVAVGKSTTARLLQALLARWPASPKVDLVTTDGFLHPNAVLEREGLMRRKGFPESYDRTTLLTYQENPIPASLRKFVCEDFSSVVSEDYGESSGVYGKPGTISVTEVQMALI